MEPVVHSLHPNSHHQIVFAKFNLKIFKHKIRHYSKANTDLTHRSISEFSWKNRFSNTDANQKVYLFNETIKNILPNFITH